MGAVCWYWGFAHLRVSISSGWCRGTGSTEPGYLARGHRFGNGRDWCSRYDSQVNCNAGTRGYWDTDVYRNQLIDADQQPDSDRYSGPDQCTYPGSYQNAHAHANTHTASADPHADFVTRANFDADSQSVAHSASYAR